MKTVWIALTLCLFPGIHLSAQELLLEKCWETDTLFRTPEAIVFDSLRQRLYVSNYNRFPRGTDINDFISVLDLEGNVIELYWIDGLKAPTGMCIHRDQLYVVDREGISIFDIGSTALRRKIFIPDAGFLNDVVVDEKGTVYFTDTSPRSRTKSYVGRIKGEEVDVLADEGINRANGLFLEDGLMLVGNTGENSLTRVDLQTGVCLPVAQLDTGILDGIRTFSPGVYLVSHWEGRMFLVQAEGQVNEVLDLREEGKNIADFEYISHRRLLVIPSFRGNRIIAYRVQ